MTEISKTSATDLQALQRRGSRQDWEDFYQKYAAIILSFCKKQGIDDFSARDVLQESMILLMRKLPHFSYSPERGRFRNWILTLVYGKIRDARRRVRRLAEFPFPDSRGIDPHLPEESYTGARDTEIEEDWRTALLEEALRRLRRNSRIQEGTLAVFEACVIQNLPVPEVAARFRLEENNIYQIKNRLLRLLREEVTSLERNPPPSPAIPSRDESFRI